MCLLLEWFASLTRDHIFATSWNPLGNANAEWSVGACEACNHRFGELEINLRDLLAICLVPDVLIEAAFTLLRCDFSCNYEVTFRPTASSYASRALTTRTIS